MPLFSSLFLRKLEIENIPQGLKPHNRWQVERPKAKALGYLEAKALGYLEAKRLRSKRLRSKTL
jgi:hypothetical protein